MACYDETCFSCLPVRARKAGTVRRKATLTDLDIPKLVKEVGQSLGLTQEQLARKVGAPHGLVNHWENSKRRL